MLPILYYIMAGMFLLQIFDPLEKRYEPPYPQLKPAPNETVKEPAYLVDMSMDKLGFVVKRKVDGSVM